VDVNCRLCKCTGNTQPCGIIHCCGPLIISSTVFNLTTPLFVSSLEVNQGELIVLAGGSISTQGNLTLMGSSQLALSLGSTPTPLQVGGCANLGGALILSRLASTPNSVTVLNASCITGAFSSVSVVGSDASCTSASLIPPASSDGSLVLVVAFSFQCTDAAADRRSIVVALLVEAFFYFPLMQ